MTGVTVYRVAEDGLSRERWDFHTTADYCEFGLILSGYGIERRKQAKGRFAKLVSQDRWTSSDERYYHSGLKRPTSVPPDVVEEAWGMVPRSTYIAIRKDEQRIP